MIEISEATELVASHSHPLPPVLSQLETLAGHVLAQDVQSDVDSPPFDKSMMDGFAVKSADIADGNTVLDIIARVNAGSQFDGALQSGQAVQIMTGAPVPTGADAVVMVEETSEQEDRVTIRASVRQGQNILTRGLSMKNGQSVMNQGAPVRAEDIGLLAEAGVVECQVVRRPTLAVIATGDELIDASFQPSGSQIRNSNGPMLSALAKPYCSAVMNLGIGPDHRDLLGTRIAEGLHRDVLVLSGGVSAGVADLVPDLLREAGVEQVFHKVKIKPGKPVWFGVSKRANGQQTLVFGLPGNPVSSMVCFRVFVAPALLRLAGRDSHSEKLVGRLTGPHRQRPGRTTYWPSKMNRTGEGLTISPLDWKGSADLKTLAEANCFGVFPGDRDSFDAGEPIHIFPM